MKGLKVFIVSFIVFFIVFHFVHLLVSIMWYIFIAILTLGIVGAIFFYEWIKDKWNKLFGKDKEVNL